MGTLRAPKISKVFNQCSWPLASAHLSKLTFHHSLLCFPFALPPAGRKGRAYHCTPSLCLSTCCPWPGMSFPSTMPFTHLSPTGSLLPCITTYFYSRNNYISATCLSVCHLTSLRTPWEHNKSYLYFVSSCLCRCLDRTGTSGRWMSESVIEWVCEWTAGETLQMGPLIF